MDDDKEALFAELADVPELVEVRGLLRRARSRAIGSQADGEGGFVLAPAHDLAVTYGAPGPGVLRDLVDAAVAAGLDASRLELHAPEPVAGAWQEVGLTEPLARAQVLRWREGAEEHVDALVRHDVRSLAPGDEALSTLPNALRRELGGLESWPACAASFAGGGIASLAYSFVETETLWDASIDTIPAFRREGFATSAAGFLIARQLERGLRPVWGARTTNAASLALASRLGFEPIATITIARLVRGEP